MGIVKALAAETDRWFVFGSWKERTAAGAPTRHEVDAVVVSVRVEFLPFLRRSKVEAAIASPPGRMQIQDPRSGTHGRTRRQLARFDIPVQQTSLAGRQRARRRRLFAAFRFRGTLSGHLHKVIHLACGLGCFKQKVTFDRH